MLDSIPPSSIVFAIAGLALAAIAATFGPAVDPWGPLRRALLPPMDAALSRIGGYAETTAPEAEYVATVYASLEEIEQALFEGGFRQYPLASLATTADGRTETASWARHSRLWSTRQLHNRVFDARHETYAYELYAHDEYTAHLPHTAARHYRGVGLDREKGVEKTREWLARSGLAYEILDE